MRFMPGTERRSVTICRAVLFRGNGAFPDTTAGGSLRGLMMDFPLTLTPLIERAEKIFGKVEIVSRRPDRSLARTTYAEFGRRTRRLARALTDAGLARGDRVATLMWNHAAHLEAYFGVPAAGGVLHTLNLRLHPSEIAGIVNHAGDRFLLVDDVLLPLYEQFRSQVKFERVIVAPFGGDDAPRGMESYEALLARAGDGFIFPALDENEAATMCYTSGTTGAPKGVLYSHRALVLHAMVSSTADAFGIAQNDVALPVASMFHVNGWGVPYAAVMFGAKLVFPGPHANPSSLLHLIEQEGVTVAFGVPTVWLAVAAELEKNPGRWKLGRPLRINCGGAAPPIELIRTLAKHNIELTHVYGMTESAPHATASRLRSYMRDWPAAEKDAVRTKQGFPAPFLEMRVMRTSTSYALPFDARGKQVQPAPTGQAPQDGKTAGELEIRGPWVASSYYNAPEEANRWTADGWFRTGDVACVDDDGYVKIVDRIKDLIKSGGEWISSVDMENALMGHPAVREAAVIGVPHAKLQERPVAVVVLQDGLSVGPEELRAFLAERFAKWQLPDEIVFADKIPRTSVGKFKKSVLRDQFAAKNRNASRRGA
jgi:fatty-acyl-CoA synthase